MNDFKKNFKKNNLEWQTNINNVISYTQLFKISSIR